MTITSSLKFLYIYGGSGLLCGGCSWLVRRRRLRRREGKSLWRTPRFAAHSVSDRGGTHTLRHQIAFIISASASEQPRSGLVRSVSIRPIAFSIIYVDYALRGLARVEAEADWLMSGSGRAIVCLLIWKKVILYKSHRELSLLVQYTL